MAELESIVRDRICNNWNSVRKAFLELDSDFDGRVTAEDIFKIFGVQSNG